MFSIFEVIFLSLFSLGILGLFKRTKKLPPGPKGIPLIGNAYALANDTVGSFLKWSDEYGPIKHLKPFRMLLLNDAQAVKEMFSDSSFVGKVWNPVMMLLSSGRWGILNTEGEAWEAHRRFTIRGLRDFGFSKGSMEGLIMDEVSETLKLFKENVGKPFSVADKLNVSVSNSLWTIINGERNSQEDSLINHFCHEFLRCLNLTFAKGLFDFPWLRHIFPERSGFKDLAKSVDWLNGFVIAAVDEHKISYIENRPRDLIDLYFDEISKAKPGTPFYKEIGERHMIASIVDLFLAGNETTSVTLTWAILYLCCHPMIQNKFLKEIDQVVGEHRSPSLTDRSNMPFTEALIMEVLRKSTLVPFGVQHRATRDHEFRGYFIKKNTTIIPNLQYILNNPKVWGDPENFRPERFLNEDGSQILKNPELIPFQLGKRQCPGEGFAKDTLFLFLTSIFQKYEILTDPEHPRPNLNPFPEFLNSPKPFKIILMLRKFH